jgi:hypothetical protein
MKNIPALESIRQKYLALLPVMDERMRRQWAAAEASALGWGGVTMVSTATGLARNTIASGLRELEHRQAHPGEAVGHRIRGPGGGRKPVTQTDPGLWQALDAWTPWLIRSPEGTRNLPCAGRARAHASWQKNSSGRTIP